MHQLLAVHADAEAAVVLNQRHAATVGRLCFCESDVRFHFLEGGKNEEECFNSLKLRPSEEGGQRKRSNFAHAYAQRPTEPRHRTAST